VQWCCRCIDCCAAVSRYSTGYHDIMCVKSSLTSGFAMAVVNRAAAAGAVDVCVVYRWGFCGWSFLNSHHELLVSVLDGT
jgi:hypothetical protein